MAKKTQHGVSSIDIASALDNLVSKTATDRNHLKNFAERIFGWSKEAAKVHDDLIIAQDKEAMKEQRDQIDRFVVSHIEGDDSCLRGGTLVAMDLAAVFWGMSALKRMILRTETFCTEYERIMASMAGHRAGYGRIDDLYDIHSKLRHCAAEAFHSTTMTDNALKAYTLMSPSSYSCLHRTQLTLRKTRDMMNLIDQLQSVHQRIVTGSYKARHREAAQQRFAMA